MFLCIDNFFLIIRNSCIYSNIYKYILIFLRQGLSV